MVFSGLTFLLLFLPALLILYFLSRDLRWRNGVLVIFSLVFYAWGEPVMVLLLLATVRPRIPGTWEREVMYLPYYGCDAIMTVTFRDDGTAFEILTDADTGEILHAEEGTWIVEGFTVKYVELGSSIHEGHSPYHYNPITGTLTNNKTYTKIR